MSDLTPNSESAGTVDVAIVGAGPAGAWAAQRLARAGARVALFDPSHPREKPCGGGITGRALELVHAHLAPGAVPGVAIASATFTHGARAADVGLTGDRSGFPPLLVAGRREFDGAMLAAAMAAGAAHCCERVTAVARGSGDWIVSTRTRACRAQWIIGADGANSLVRRHVAAPFARADLSIAAGYFVHGTSSRDIVVAFEDEPPGYLWSFPRPDHLAVGICAQADRAGASVLLARTRHWIERHVPAAAALRLERYSWPIPSLSERALAVDSFSGDRWMLAGDAAGLVDPITREGIFFALRSGEMAADALIAGVNSAARYAAHVRDEIHPELVRAAQLRARFFQPRFIDLLLKGLTRSQRVREVMADLVAGRQTYRGLRRRLLRTIEWRLMLELFGY
ncbi:MAG TPA: geranylgeranyl reductase family protein [Vicinamibacterales bacterium]|nr:geranylgeranyl reductase family protein [Vicinamibacterales bacterium]